MNQFLVDEHVMHNCSIFLHLYLMKTSDEIPFCRTRSSVFLQVRTSWFYIVISILTVLFVLFFYVFIYLYKRYLSSAHLPLYRFMESFNFDSIMMFVLQGNENETAGAEAPLGEWKKEKTFIDGIPCLFNYRM